MRSILNFRGLQSAVLFATWAVASVGCSSESASDDEGSESCEIGTERCDCYRNDSCDDGLMCVSDVCVKDTGADDGEDAGSNASNEDDAPGADPDENDGADEADDSEEDPTAAEEDPDESEQDPTATDDDRDESEQDETTADEAPDESDASADDGEETEPAEETSDEETQEAPEQQELEDGSVGSACGECDGALVCFPDVPGGYCTMQCEVDADCGADGACVQNLCYRACGDDADCRPSYACLDAGEVSVCDVGESTEPGSDNAAGSCANTCEHYLTCKGIFDSETQQTCESNCENSGYASDDLAAFQETDCETAIYMVEGPASSEGGSSGGGAVDCDGCQWDGSSCVYLSQYTLISTAGITCDASCCN